MLPSGLDDNAVMICTIRRHRRTQGSLFMPTVAWIDDRERFRAIASAWNSLAPGSPCLRHEWLDAWWEAYGDGCELRIGWVTDDQGEPIGGLPLLRQSTVPHGRLLRLLGSGAACSDGVGVLASAGRESETVDALAAALTCPTPARSPSVRWDEWDWDGVAATDASTAALIDKVRGEATRTRECGQMSTWRMNFPSAPFEPFSLASSKTQRKFRRLAKSFESGDMVLNCATDAASFERGERILIELHQKRRQSLGEPGCFADPRFERFYRAATASLFHRGLWRIYWIEYQGTPIGVQSGSFLDNIFFSYQTGLEPAAFDREPGWLVQIGLLRTAAAQGWTAIDYMRGDEPYKATLGCKPTPVRRIRLCHSRFSARSRFALYHLARDAKHWWDSVPNSLPSLPAATAFNGVAATEKP